MKKRFAASAGALIALSTLMGSPSAYASTTYHMQKSSIVVDGQVFSQPFKFVAGSPSTTYMPVFYVQQLLNKVLNLDASTDVWDGVHHTWTLTVNGANPTLISQSSGASISVNGTVVESAPTLTAIDPSNGKTTTFMPIWYVQQLINQLLKLDANTNAWDGIAGRWTLSPHAPKLSKVQVVKDFVTALGITPDNTGTNPYDDVSATDWPYVNAVMGKGYFNATSSSHFGADDQISVYDVDHAYQLYVGIPDEDMSWNAGGTLSAWANAIQLNKGLASGNVSPVEEGTLKFNLTSLHNGYSKDSNGTYHLWFQPFDLKKTDDSVPIMTASIASKGQSDALPLVDAVTLKVNSDGTMTFSLPGLSVLDNRSVTCGAVLNHVNYTQYSLDNGRTWHNLSPDGWWYDSWDLNNGATKTPPKTVLVKTKGHTEIGAGEVAANRPIPFAWIAVDPAASGGAPTITSSSGVAQ